MSITISDLRAREILDCRGFPTVEVDVYLDGRMAARADVPAGRSTGKREAVELRDGGSRWDGQGVRRAVENVNAIIQPALIGMDPSDQKAVDARLLELDGTVDKSRLGANALVGVSLAVLKAAASAANQPLYRHLNPDGVIIPVPLMNLINGGKLTSNDLEIQEFMVIPVGASHLLEALQMVYEVNMVLRDMIVARYGKIAANVGDEGGFAPPMTGVEEPMATLAEAVEKAGYSDEILYGLDAAASHWYDWERERYRMDGREMGREAVIAMYIDLCRRYPIRSIEDPLMEDDFKGHAILTDALQGVQIVGDDLFTTNVDHIQHGIDSGAANAILWKFNQVGTITEALEAAQLARESGFGVQVSERSGETEDTSIADFSVALNCGQIKTGTTRGERTAKYNQLLRIQEQLGPRAVYAGHDFLRPELKGS